MTMELKRLSTEQCCTGRFAGQTRMPVSVAVLYPINRHYCPHQFALPYPWAFS